MHWNHGARWKGNAGDRHHISKHRAQTAADLICFKIGVKVQACYLHLSSAAVDLQAAALYDVLTHSYLGHTYHVFIFSSLLQGQAGPGFREDISFQYLGDRS